MLKEEIEKELKKRSSFQINDLVRLFGERNRNIIKKIVKQLVLEGRVCVFRAGRQYFYVVV